MRTLPGAHQGARCLMQKLDMVMHFAILLMIQVTLVKVSTIFHCAANRQIQVIGHHRPMLQWRRRRLAALRGKYGDTICALLQPFL